MGAEFVRGRVCPGPSLLGAEMSKNPGDTFFSESQTCPRPSESIPSMTGRCFKLSDKTDNFILNSVSPFLRGIC